MISAWRLAAWIWRLAKVNICDAGVAQEELSHNLTAIGVPVFWVSAPGRRQTRRRR